jgi:signal transduction histidine kinase
MAKELHSSAMALVNLLGDVLDVTRFDAGRIELQESEFELRDLLSMEAKHLMPLARDKGLSFTLEDRPYLWLRADKVKLARVVGNLVGNAIKFTEKGQVKLSYDLLDDGRVRVSVTDTGVGIAAEHVAYIFDEFFQLRNPERDRNKGNGLGLTICKRLADAMGAELKVDTTPNAGSTFAIVLPASAVVARG